MRLNKPVTQHEVAVPDGEPLVSRTDPSGNITFANHVFVKTSGFTEQELLGSPHNLVRHPTMPQAAFADLWATIKAGRPWDGLVKNRAKSGGFYWVRANVTPVIEDGKTGGFISIRSKPSRDEVAAAEATYAVLRDGKAKRIGLRDGELMRRGWRATLVVAGQSVRGHLAAAMLAAILVILAVGWLGFAGMAASNQVLQRVYEHDLVAVNQLRSVVDRVRDNRNHIAQMAAALRSGIRAEDAIKEREPPIRANLAQIDELWRGYKALALSPEQQAAAQKFADQYATLLGDAIEPALALARLGDAARLDSLFQKQAPPLFQAVFDSNRQLVDLQIERGRVAYAESVASLRWRLIIGATSAAGGLLLVLAVGWTVLRTVRRCVQAFEGHFAAIIRGDFDVPITRPAAHEFHHMASMLRAMRAHLVYKRWEAAEFERKAADIRRETVEQMALTIEQEAGSAVERVAERTGAMARDADAMAGSAERVSTNAERVAGAADQALKNAQVVAAASEQLAASIREVSTQVEHASGVSRTAAGKGADARATIRSLSEAAERIGAVVRMIADIAGQTNLLALNATIEAARAGEAGKGFAVVAGEVKTLASQTAKATEEISQQITSLRGATDAAVSAVEDIGHTLDEVAQVAMSVAAAIDQQTAATHEIARNVAESGSAVQEVTNRIAEVSREAADTGQQAGRLRADSGAVATEIATLRGALVRTIRTATTDADRRTEARIAVSEPCTLVIEGSGSRFTGTALDVSAHGASINVSRTGITSGQRGTLNFDHRAGAQARFHVVAVDPEGRIHVQFDTASQTPALQAMIAALDIGQPRGARSAAA